MKKYSNWIYALIAAVLVIFNFINNYFIEKDNLKAYIDNVPEFSGSPYAVINSNVPFFTEDEYSFKSFEKYSKLDRLGRNGVAFASIGPDIMPTEEREAIGMVKPAGWHTIKYDWIEGKYLYNRCHLLGFQLTGENANEENLITGTRYLNVEGMLPFENLIADYVKKTGYHVLLRVTPVYTGDNLIADGILMEGLSMEDEGEGVSFNVYCYNVQPGVIIDYATGKSKKDDSYSSEKPIIFDSESTYILNKNTKKAHLETCPGAADIKDKNKDIYYGKLQDIINGGYDTCSQCIN